MGTTKVSRPQRESVQVSDPIAFILEEHDRQVETCSRLEELVSVLEVEPVVDWARSLLAFFTEELPLHFEDEELDLFPLLLSKGRQVENLNEILEQLVSEHELDRGLVEPIVEGLQVIASGESPANPIRFERYVRAFTEAQRRHLNWENRLVIPIAQQLLNETDRADLARRIAARRRD